MHKRLLGLAFAIPFIAWYTAAVPVHAADTYTVDPVHSGVTFRIKHAGIAWIQGRFNKLSGSFTIDPNDASKCSFTLTIETESVDTNNPQRDGHLRSPDFFNSKQFPAILFKSTSIKPSKDGYQVTGELTMHGVTKPVEFMLVGGGKIQFPPGVQRTGFTTDFSIKRSDFGVGPEKFAQMLSDEVRSTISIEGTKK